MSYKSFTANYERKVDALPMWAAFSDQQMVDELNQRGIDAGIKDGKFWCKMPDGEKLVRVGSGLYCFKSDYKNVCIVLSSHAMKLRDNMRDPQFAEDAFFYEMNNHEYEINYEGAYDVISCFWNVEYDEYKDGEDYLRDLDMPYKIIDAWRHARKRHVDLFMENGVF